MWKVTPSNAPLVLVGASSVVSCTLGALAAHVLTKKVLQAKYEALVEQEVQQAKAYFSMRNKTGAYDDPGKIVAAKAAKAEKVEHSDKEVYVEKAGPYRASVVDISPPEPKPEPKPKSKPEPEEDMEAFEKRLIREAKEEVDDVKRRLDVFDDDEDEYDEEIVVVKNVFAEEVSADSDRNTRKPYVLSQREFEEGEFDYSQNTLTYYEADQVLTDDRDQPIHHMQKIVGTEHLKFGGESNDPNVVYIRNNELEVDFEVCRSPGSFTEEVLGYKEPSNKARPRKFREFD